ncbi:MAG TPA: hypothetical protein VGD55_14545, partial [Acidothermaceae bacterium]
HMSKRPAAFIPAGVLGTVIMSLIVAFLVPHHTTSAFFVHLLLIGAVVGSVEVVAGMVIIAFALRKTGLPPSG